MEELYELFMGVALLILGIPIGNILAKLTKEELTKGKGHFKFLIIFSLIGAIVFLILENDAFLFSFLFIIIVLSRSLKE